MGLLFPYLFQIFILKGITCLSFYYYSVDFAGHIEDTNNATFKIERDEEPPTIIYVDDNADPGWYNATHVRTIQEGVKNVSECGSVFVYEGVYHEEVIIDKEFHLHGQNTAGHTAWRQKIIFSSALFLSGRITRYCVN